MEGALEMFTSVRWGENYIAALRKEIRIQKVDVQTFDMNQNMSLYIYYFYYLYNKIVIDSVEIWLKLKKTKRT